MTTPASEGVPYKDDHCVRLDAEFNCTEPPGWRRVDVGRGASEKKASDPYWCVDVRRAAPRGCRLTHPPAHIASSRRFHPDGWRFRSMPEVNRWRAAGSGPESLSNKCVASCGRALASDPQLLTPPPQCLYRPEHARQVRRAGHHCARGHREGAAHGGAGCQDQGLGARQGHVARGRWCSGHGQALRGCCGAAGGRARRCQEAHPGLGMPRAWWWWCWGGTGVSRLR